jgi:hypothetical protein
MRKAMLLKMLSGLCVLLLVLQSCKDDSDLIAPVPLKNQSFTEEFDTAAAAFARGWEAINVSDPIGPAVWQDGGNLFPFFNAYSNNGSNVGFIGCEYLSTSAASGTISNWLVSPRVLMQNGDKIVFYARGQIVSPGYTATDTTDFANRMQLCLNGFGDDLDVGHDFDPGHFTTVLVDINPEYKEWHARPGTYAGVPVTAADIAKAFPSEWPRFEGTVNGLREPGYHRFAFRYLLADAGSNGRGTGVGVDKVAFISTGK